MKRQWLPLLCLFPMAVFAQHDIKIDLGYFRMMQQSTPFDFSSFRVGVGYSITDWCVAGAFGSYGGHSGNVNYYEAGSYDQVEYSGTLMERYYHYGVDVELHPVAAFFPDFHWIDPYCQGELGLRTTTEHYSPEYDGALATPIRNDFLYGGSLGLAINPLKYFGVFYECALDNLNKEIVYHDANTLEQKPKPIHRFGIIIRIPIVR